MIASDAVGTQQIHSLRIWHFAQAAGMRKGGRHKKRVQWHDAQCSHTISSRVLGVRSVIFEYIVNKKAECFSTPLCKQCLKHIQKIYIF